MKYQYKIEPEVTWNGFGYTVYRKKLFFWRFVRSYKYFTDAYNDIYKCEVANDQG
jgi:hypothetical protein